MGKPVTSADLVSRLGHREFISAVVRGILSRGKASTLSPQGLEAELARIRDLVGYTEAAETASLDRSQPLIVLLERPIGETGQRIRFLALYHGGRLVGNIEDLDAEFLKEGHLIGADSLDELLRHAFEGYALPTIQQRRAHHPGPSGPSKPKAPPKKKPALYPEYIIHPAVVEYFSGHRGFLISEAFSDRVRRPKTLQRKEDLTKAGLPDKFLQASLEAGYSVSIQGAVDFIRSNKGVIYRRQNSRIKFLLTNGQVTGCIRDYLNELLTLGEGAGTVQQERTDPTKPNYEVALQHLALSSNVRGAYAYFSQQSRRVENVPINEMFAALRGIATEIARTDETLESRICKSMGEWIRVAEAADVVDTDARINRAAKLFEPREPDNGDIKISDRVYRGMMALTRNLINREFQYSTDEFDFIIRGLWVKGLLPKSRLEESGLELGEEAEKPAYLEVDRELTGLNAQYGCPIKRLMMRFEDYDKVLWPAFMKQLKAGRIQEGISLGSGQDDYRLALIIYDTVPKNVAKGLFRSFTSGNPLSEPSRSERGPNNMLSWTLQYYVGSQRERFIGEIQKHYRKGA
jgi:hypothetical protein